MKIILLVTVILFCILTCISIYEYMNTELTILLNRETNQEQVNEYFITNQDLKIKLTDIDDEIIQSIPHLSRLKRLLYDSNGKKPKEILNILNIILNDSEEYYSDIDTIYPILELYVKVDENVIKYPSESYNIYLRLNITKCHVNDISNESSSLNINIRSGENIIMNISSVYIHEDNIPIVRIINNLTKSISSIDEKIKLKNILSEMICFNTECVSKEDSEASDAICNDYNIQEDYSGCKYNSVCKIDGTTNMSKKELCYDILNKITDETNDLISESVKIRFRLFDTEDILDVCSYY